MDDVIHQAKNCPNCACPYIGGQCAPCGYSEEPHECPPTGVVCPQCDSPLLPSECIAEMRKVPGGCKSVAEFLANERDDDDDWLLTVDDDATDLAPTEPELPEVCDPPGGESGA